jgi:hypothetical protein
MRTKSGDIIEICSLKYHADTVTVESLSNQDVYEDIQIGTLAIFLKKTENGANVMLNSGFIGWVFDDEWQPVKF